MAGSTTLERMLIVGRVDTPTVLGIWARVQSLATGTLEAQRRNYCTRAVAGLYLVVVESADCETTVATGSHGSCCIRFLRLASPLHAATLV